MNLVEEYLREMYDIRASGSAVKETSYYPALSNLLNGIGKGLKPRVRCVINLKNRGAGMPDGGCSRLTRSSEDPPRKSRKARFPRGVSSR
jgi:hypothetical protein